MEITDRELTLLNFYRASELQGGLILGRLVEHVRDPELILRLTEHSAEEVMHAQLWTETIVAVGGRPAADVGHVPGAVCGGDRHADVAARGAGADAGVRARRVSAFRARTCGARARIRCVQATLRRMLDDERGHLSWVQEWLGRQTGSRRAAIPALCVATAAVDAAIRAQLLVDYEWEELACAS